MGTFANCWASLPHDEEKTGKNQREKTQTSGPECTSVGDGISAPGTPSGAEQPTHVTQWGCECHWSGPRAQI